MLTHAQLDAANWAEPHKIRFPRHARAEIRHRGRWKQAMRLTRMEWQIAKGVVAYLRSAGFSGDTLKHAMDEARLVEMAIFALGPTPELSKSMPPPRSRAEIAARYRAMLDRCAARDAACALNDVREAA